jgi:hypothetical protein
VGTVTVIPGLAGEAVMLAVKVSDAVSPLVSVAVTLMLRL